MNYEEVSDGEDRIQISCEGSIENSNDFQFLETYLNRDLNVDLDLTGLSYVNSCGFGAMVEESMNFADKGLELTIKGLKPTIRKTLALLGAEELLHFVD
jgi:anti-anti-sigma factor